MVAAPVAAEQEAPLCALLAKMCREPGMADPNNALVPFGAFPELHVARFVILRDETLDDLAQYGSEFRVAPVWLAFLSDFDGDCASMLTRLIAHAESGLRAIFAHCQGYTSSVDLHAWMRARAVAPATIYANWVGRTVRQIREEQALHAAMRAWSVTHAPALAGAPASQARARLIDAMRGSVTLTPPAPTPAGWRLARLINLVSVPLIALLLSPLLIVGAPFYAWALRRHEKADAVITPRPEPAHVAALAVQEDHQVSNQFSAFGSVKPGKFRLWTLRAVFVLLQFSTRHIYTRGRLARVGTIHFTRWVFMDDHRRVFFASNYDGSEESYMDDFINKAAFGLNLVFSNGVGWPRTRWLVLGGANREQEFKHFLRRHQVPTLVWYKAYPDLSAADLATNTRIREGFEKTAMTEEEARRWLALI